jgi:hypothetical protein
MKTSGNEEVSFPAWWNTKQKHKRLLLNMHVHHTRDLIIAAHRDNGREVNLTDTDPVTIPVDELYEFCNSRLGGMNMYLKLAFREKDVVVSGRRPHTIISHIPSPSPVDTYTDCYGWKEEEEEKSLLLPDECVCPLTLEVFVDPVCASDGFTYERRDMQEWLLFHSTSPLTGEELSSPLLFPNHRMRQLVERLFPS